MIRGVSYKLWYGGMITKMREQNKRRCGIYHRFQENKGTPIDLEPDGRRITFSVFEVAWFFISVSLCMLAYSSLCLCRVTFSPLVDLCLSLTKYYMESKFKGPEDTMGKKNMFGLTWLQPSSHHLMPGCSIIYPTTIQQVR